jgi:hypothetical protein
MTVDWRLGTRIITQPATATLNTYLFPLVKKPCAICVRFTLTPCVYAASTLQTTNSRRRGRSLNAMDTNYIVSYFLNERESRFFQHVQTCLVSLLADVIAALFSSSFVMRPVATNSCIFSAEALPILGPLSCPCPCQERCPRSLLRLGRR